MLIVIERPTRSSPYDISLKLNLVTSVCTNQHSIAVVDLKVLNTCNLEIKLQPYGFMHDFLLTNKDAGIGVLQMTDQTRRERIGNRAEVNKGSHFRGLRCSPSNKTICWRIVGCCAQHCHSEVWYIYSHLGFLYKGLCALVSFTVLSITFSNQPDPPFDFLQSLTTVEPVFFLSSNVTSR